MLDALIDMAFFSYVCVALYVGSYWVRGNTAALRALVLEGTDHE